MYNYSKNGSYFLLLLNFYYDLFIIYRRVKGCSLKNMYFFWNVSFSDLCPFCAAIDLPSRGPSAYTHCHWSKAPKGLPKHCLNIESRIYFIILENTIFISYNFLGLGRPWFDGEPRAGRTGILLWGLQHAIQQEQYNALPYNCTFIFRLII